MAKPTLIIQQEPQSEQAQRTTFFNLWQHKERGNPMVTGKNSSSSIGYNSEEEARGESDDGAYIRIAILKVTV